MREQADFLKNFLKMAFWLGPLSPKVNTLEDLIEKSLKFRVKTERSRHVFISLRGQFKVFFLSHPVFTFWGLQMNDLFVLIPF